MQSMLGLGTIELWHSNVRIFFNLEISILCKISLHKEKLSKQKCLSGINICYPWKVVYDLLPKTGVFHQFHPFSTEIFAKSKG